VVAGSLIGGSAGFDLHTPAGIAIFASEEVRMADTVDVTIPVDVELAKHLDTPARRQAVGRYLSGVIEGRTRTRRSCRGDCLCQTRGAHQLADRRGHRCRAADLAGRQPDVIVVLDALTFGCAALKANSVPEQALLLAVDEPNRLRLSREVEDEYREVIFCPKFDHYVSARRRQLIFEM